MTSGARQRRTAVRGGGAAVGLAKAEVAIVKTDPARVDLLKATCTGVGHRSHLDRRSWISVSLDADAPWDEIESLADQSFVIVCETLTRKQRDELGR